MSTRYADVGDEWWKVPKVMDLQCCDCGLVHLTRFRIKITKGKPSLEMRMDRNERATAQVRRNRRRKR